MTALKIGQQTADGIYVGQYESKSLGKIFNVFAAPENVGKRNWQQLGDLLPYKDTVEKLAKKKNWHGFDGTNYANAEAFQAALKDGAYTGGWIIPTKEMVKNNLSHLKEDLMKANLHNDWYWSSSEHSVFKGNIYSIRWWDGYEVYSPSPAHCRPVRLVEAGPAAPKA